MANSNQGDARFANWVHPLNSSLPPKGPPVVMDAAAFPFSAACTGVRNNNNNGVGGSSTSNSKQHHHRPPSAGFVPQLPVPWMDDMLDSPEAPARKIHHRRSASDTAAFLEMPESSSKLPEELQRDEDFGYRNLSCGAAVLPMRTSDFERLDDEQIMSMFGATEGDPSQRSIASRSGTVSSGGGTESLDKKLCSDVPSSPSDSNSGNEMSIEEVRPGPLNFPKTEPEEVQSVNAGEVPTTIGPSTTSTTGKQPTASCHIDPNMDPKRAKRILANRQSAQRSRVRKLQYIAELERSVTALQTEVSALTPQVAFLDHQRILLNVDNNTIKQRIASLMQDKRFKDAHNEALTREVHRLRQVLQQQEELRSQFHHYNNTSLPPNSTAEVTENEGKQDPFGLKSGSSCGAGTVDRAQGSTTTNGLLGENGTDLVDHGHGESSQEFAKNSL